MRKMRDDHLQEVPPVNDGHVRCRAGPSIQKQLRQAALPRPHSPIMVPLPSHSLKQWGQLGEILGGVGIPERGASCGLVIRPVAWGSSVECRHIVDIRSHRDHLIIASFYNERFHEGGLCFCGINSEN